MINVNASAKGIVRAEKVPIGIIKNVFVRIAGM